MTNPTPQQLVKGQPVRVLSCAGPWVYVGPSRSRFTPCVRVARADGGRALTVPASQVFAVTE